MEIIRYSKENIEQVIEFEEELRNLEPDWGWEINEEYKIKVKNSFNDVRFKNSISFLAVDNNKVVGRIDASLITSHFDGSVKAYLDWICVLKNYRHKGVGQLLMKQLRFALNKEYNVDTLIGLIASNSEARRFYESLDNSFIRDQGIWIDC